MKTTANNTESKNERLILGKKYFCNWAWRQARYIGTRKDERGRKRAYFKDICDCIISIDADNALENIDFKKTASYNQ